MANNIQTDATSQLANIPFGKIIGGPLDAAIKAQAQAAETSIKFIQAVAFTDTGDVRNVTFLYERDGQKVKLVVPILAIVPIPYIRIEDLTISFKASLSAETVNRQRDASRSRTSVGNKTRASGKHLFVEGSTEFNASYSSKKDSRSSQDSRYSVEYTMDVTCHAVQDDIPGGLGDVLNILRESIKSNPLGTITLAQGTSVDVSAPAAGSGSSPTQLTFKVDVTNANGDPAPENTVISIGSDDERFIFVTPNAKVDTAGQAEFTVEYGELPVMEPAPSNGTVVYLSELGFTANSYAGSAEFNVVAA